MTTVIEQGNCLELMATLPDKSVDLLICDLPYGEMANVFWDTQIDMVEFWKQFRRIRRSKHVACIHFCTTKFGYSLIKSWEKGFKMDLVMKKRYKVGAMNSHCRPLRDHEMIYFFYEKPPKYNRDKYHKKLRPNEVNPNQGTGGEKTIYGGLHTDIPKVYGYDVPNPGSVIDGHVPKKGRFHITQKPQSVLEFLLKYWSDEGDTILDPTMGSGSTGVACQGLGRNFIGYELDEEIFEVARERLSM